MHESNIMWICCTPLFNSVIEAEVSTAASNSVIEAEISTSPTTSIARETDTSLIAATRGVLYMYNFYYISNLVSNK